MTYRPRMYRSNESSIMDYVRIGMITIGLIGAAIGGSYKCDSKEPEVNMPTYNIREHQSDINKHLEKLEDITRDLMEGLD